MKQDSKRHHYYIVEEPYLMRFLESLRNTKIRGACTSVSHQEIASADASI